MEQKMRRSSQTAGRWSRGLLVAAGLLALAACATPFRAQVSRFQMMPPPAGQSFVVEPADPRHAGSIEFRTYAAAVEQEMQRNGFQPAPSREAATLLVKLDFGVGPPRERIDTRPGTFVGGWGWGPRGWGWGGWGWGGWYDPWFWGPGFGPEVYTYTVYPSFVEVAIVRKADSQNLFEGRAQTTTRNSDLPFLVPRLVTALFTNFPGNSGETVNVRLPRDQG